MNLNTEVKLQVHVLAVFDKTHTVAKRNRSPSKIQDYVNNAKHEKCCIHKQINENAASVF